MVGRPLPTVQHNLERFEVRGHTHNAPKSGRPRAMNTQVEERLFRAITSDPKAKSDTFAATEGVSPTTVRRIAAQNGLYSRKCLSKPYISPLNLRRRIQWALNNVDTAWRTIMFTDESAFCIGETGTQWCAWRPGKEHLPQHESV